MVNIEKLLKQQSEILDKINNIKTNLRKDGPSRRTSEYLQLRLERLEFCWDQFSLNHSSLMMSEVEIGGQYVNDNVYEKLPKNEGTPTEQEECSGTQNKKTMEYLSEQRSNVKALERSINNLNIQDITEKWQLEDKLKTITSRWETYDALYWRLDNILNNTEPYEQDYNRLEILFEQAKTSINKKIWSCVHRERSTPRIDLPLFDGNYSQWTTFKDLFMEAVHLNPHIPATQKMQHLKSKLRGEAERLVQHLQISSDNYESCWNILKHRFDNTRLLFTHHANLLLNQHIIQQPSASQLKKMHDLTKESLNAISNLQIDIINWDPLIVHILLQKLDAETTESFNNSLSNPRELPKLEDFLSFLEHKFMSLESANKTINNSQQYKKKTSIFNEVNNKQSVKPYYSKQATYHTATRTCPKCKGNHGLYNCKEFLEMTPEGRLKTAARLHVCQNCLFGHNGNECNSKQKCKLCDQSHNSLLHQAVNKNTTSTIIPVQQPSTHVSSNENNDVLLATAQLHVKSSNGEFITLRVLLDQGSQVTFITEDAVQRLQLKKKKFDAIVTGLGDSANKCKGEVNLTCKALHNDYSFNIDALVMKILTNKLPSRSFDKDVFSCVKHLKLADPEFNIKANIDILLGADVYSDLIMEGLIKNNNKTITAQQTQLGWVLCGKFRAFSCNVVINNTDALTKFWEHEEITHKIQHGTSEDYCEQHYINTTQRRLPDGSYQVRLPMMPN